MLKVKPEQLDEFLANVEANSKRGLPQFQPEPERKGTLVLVGGGPSARDHLKTIRRLAGRSRNRVYALNSAVGWLADMGIRPHGCVMQEIAPWPASVPLKAVKGVTYYLPSFVAVDTCDKLQGVQWHGIAPGMEIVRKHIPEAWFIHCLGNAGPQTLVIGLWQGFRRFEVFGMDCSFIEQSHAYEHGEERRYQDDWNWIEAEGRKFRATPSFWMQAREVVAFHRANRGRFSLRVHGEGLLPTVHRSEFPEEYANA